MTLAPNNTDRTANTLDVFTHSTLARQATQKRTKDRMVTIERAERLNRLDSETWSDINNAAGKDVHRQAQRDARTAWSMVDRLYTPFDDGYSLFDNLQAALDYVNTFGETSESQAFLHAVAVELAEATRKAPTGKNAPAHDMEYLHTRKVALHGPIAEARKRAQDTFKGYYTVASGRDRTAPETLEFYAVAWRLAGTADHETLETLTDCVNRFRTSQPINPKTGKRDRCGMDTVLALCTDRQAAVDAITGNTGAYQG